MDNPKDNELSIVLPVFNEEAVIESTVREIDAYTRRFVGKVEIIAVNDGSTDATAGILERLGRSVLVLKTVSHAKNRGYARALQSGIKATEKAWVLLMDPDGQFHIDSLEALWPRRHGYDALLGYRQKRADSLCRIVLGRTGNALSNMFLGRRIRDINCGFKLFKGGDIRPLPLCSTGGAVNFEILYRLFKKNPAMRIYQGPVKHYPRLSGKAGGAKPWKIAAMVLEGIKIMLRKAAGP